MTWKVKMNEKRTAIDKNIRFLKNERVKFNPNSFKRLDCDKKIRRLEAEKFCFDSRYVEPVRLANGSVVNLITLTAFKKRLKHADSYRMIVRGDEVHIDYKTTDDQGRYLLADMRKEYVHWDLPKASV